MTTSESYKIQVAIDCSKKIVDCLKAFSNATVLLLSNDPEIAAAASAIRLFAEKQQEIIDNHAAFSEPLVRFMDIAHDQGITLPNEEFGANRSWHQAATGRIFQKDHLKCLASEFIAVFDLTYEVVQKRFPEFEDLACPSFSAPNFETIIRNEKLIKGCSRELDCLKVAGSLNDENQQSKKQPDSDVSANIPRFIHANNHPDVDLRDLAVKLNICDRDPNDKRSDNEVAIEHYSDLEPEPAKGKLATLKMYEGRKRKK